METVDRPGQIDWHGSAVHSEPPAQPNCFHVCAEAIAKNQKAFSQMLCALECPAGSFAADFKTAPNKVEMLWLDITGRNSASPEPKLVRKTLPKMPLYSHTGTPWFMMLQTFHASVCVCVQS